MRRSSPDRDEILAARYERIGGDEAVRVEIHVEGLFSTAVLVVVRLEIPFAAAAHSAESPQVETLSVGKLEEYIVVFGPVPGRHL